MKVKYRGHELTAERDTTLAGWDAVFITIVRLSDFYVIEDTPYYGDEPIRDIIKSMKVRVDAELKEEQKGDADGRNKREEDSGTSGARQRARGAPPR